MSETTRIAVLGLGEAGSAIARDLVAAGADVRAFDPAVPAPVGVQARESDADAVRDADLVLSLTTAHEALNALRDSLPALRRGTVWSDLNTAAPRLKLTLEEESRQYGVELADVALMAPVPGRGLNTPMEASGPGAATFAAIAGSYGASITVLPGPVGTAAGRKLLRSVFFKGLGAAVVEALEGARAAGCEDWLRANIGQQLAEFDSSAVDRLVSGSRQHARRRADEMAAAAQQLRDLGVEPRMAAGARDTLAALLAVQRDGEQDCAPAGGSDA